MSEQKRVRGRYPDEVRERAVRMVFDHQGGYPSQWKAIESISELDRHPKPLDAIGDLEDVDVGQADQQFAHGNRIRRHRDPRISKALNTSRFVESLLHVEDPHPVTPAQTRSPVNPQVVSSSLTPGALQKRLSRQAFLRIWLKGL